MTKRDYNQLLKWDKDPTQRLENYGEGRNSDYFEFMCQLYDLTGQFNCCLISTDGCSDYPEIIRYYSINYKGGDPVKVNEYDWIFSDEYDELWEEFCGMDDDKCLEIVKKYVQDNY